MTTENFVMVVIRPSEGMVLKRVDEDGRVVLSDSVYMSQADAQAHQWEEITEAEAEEIRIQQAAQAEAEAARAQSGDSAPDEQEQSSEAASE